MEQNYFYHHNSELRDNSGLDEQVKGIDNTELYYPQDLPNAYC